MSNIGLPFALGNTYWTYNLQPDYVNPALTTPEWWNFNITSSSVKLDPGHSIIVQSLEIAPLIANYIVVINPLLTMYGIMVNYCDFTTLSFLPPGFMYATITNFGQQSVELQYNTSILTIKLLNSFTVIP